MTQEQIKQQFQVTVNYRIKVAGNWEQRTVYLCNRQHLFNWLSEEWIKISKKFDTILYDINMDTPIEVSDPKMIGHVDDGAILSLDMKSALVTYIEI